MQFEELSRRLGAAGIDAQAEYARFRQHTGYEDLDRFVAYLRERKRIGGGLLCELHGSDPITVTPLAGVDMDRGGTLVLDRGNTTQALPGHAAAAEPHGVPAIAANASTLVAGPAEESDQAVDAAIAGDVDDRGYTLLGRIAKGAMGEVLVARDMELLRKVAFKRMLPEVAARPALAARFFSEVQITAQLDHPNIVPIYELEVGKDGALGYSMKLIQGRTLTAIVEDSRRRARDGKQRREARRLTRRLESFLKVCDAISYAHEKGVLHRDLKPDNVMVGRFREVYVMDWGICRLMGVPDAHLADDAGASGDGPGTQVMHGSTQYGTILGTPGYMSPEQAQGRAPELDARSDLYALGLILYELVSLRAAVTGATAQDTLARAARGEKMPLVHHNPRLRVPRELRAVIDKATAVDRDQRYATVKDMADDVRAYLRSDAVAAQPDNPVQAVARWLGRHKAVALSAILVLLLAGAAAVIALLIREERSLHAAQVREERMQAFLLRVSRHSHAIDSHFYRYERAIARLAGRVNEVLARGDLGQVPVYTSRDFEDPDRAPADLQPAPYYGQPASIDHPVFKLAPGLPGMEAPGVQRQVWRLAHLRPAFEELLLDSAELAPGERKDMSRARARELIADTGVPVLRTFATLASGVHVSYPGLGGYPDDYDGRLRPKYTLSAQEQGIVWGNPFPDRYGHGLILAGSTALHDAQGTFVGVTGLEMTFTWLIDHLLTMPDAPYVDASFLVDGQGRVIIQAGDAPVVAPLHGDERGDVDSPAMRAAMDSETIDLAPLPYADVLAALGEQRAGHVEIEAGGRTRLAVFYPIDALGWWYVVIADEAELL